VSIHLDLIGGPADGQSFAVPDDQPPYLWRVPIPAPIADLFRDLSELVMPRVAEYEPLLEGGWRSITDEGHHRYRYRGTPEPHVRQSRPTPTVDELAVMVRDPARTAYPSGAAHLLACRTRFSLNRDGRLNPEERAAIDTVAWAHVRGALEERRRGA
jgi:hypothetical protein